ncbi:MAG: hypothetical protein N3I86_16255, partial [Verrucomicrobiae bacterium]|nr:hypothetical protein [Verrucomicrobiae bacterium]
MLNVRCSMLNVRCSIFCGASTLTLALSLEGEGMRMPLNASERAFWRAAAFAGRGLNADLVRIFFAQHFHAGR